VYEGEEKMEGERKSSERRGPFIDEVEHGTLARLGWAKRGALPRREASISGCSFPRNKIT